MQFPLLRALGKRSVMHFLGSDIRGKAPEELAWAQRAGARVVGSYDAIRWVPDAHVIPPGIDVRAIEPAPPTNRRAPGRAARAVVARAEGDGARRRRVRALDVDLEIVEGSTTARRSSGTRRADMVVDQLNAGWYGVFAIEAMALGKPVVTFLHDEAVRRTEEAFGLEVPIVARRRRRSSSAAAARRVGGGAQRVGAASRAYVERCTTSSA